MQIDVISLFPEVVRDYVAVGVIRRAFEQGLVNLNLTNPREFTQDVHQTVDDRPYGGGAGMVMRYDCLASAFDQIATEHGTGLRIAFSPQGVPLTHDLLVQLSKQSHLVMLCGRYEGVDERINQRYIDLECSIGDYVLSGGELAACVLIDGVLRLLPNVLGHADSAANDSFATGLLDTAHYTRPEQIDELGVPRALLSGNHQEIERFRLKQALGNTWQKRPELFAKRRLQADELALLNEFLQENRSF